MRKRYPTPYSDVNQILDLALHDVESNLGDQFIGMYLYGSLSRGDFNLETSDIDFLVVTADWLPPESIHLLELMHRRIWESPLERAARLEGAYVPKSLLLRHDPHGGECPCVNEGRFYVARLGSDWIIQRHIVRQYGVIVAGPDPRALIDPVSPSDIRDAVIGILREWWFPMLENPAWLSEHGSNYHGYSVITMCRALHALEHGTVVSKPVAVGWARGVLDSRWHGLIDRAVASQYGIHADFLNETLEFIRYTQDQIASIEATGGESRYAPDSP